MARGDTGAATPPGGDPGGHHPRARGGGRGPDGCARYADRGARRRFCDHAPESTKRGKVTHCSTTKRLTKSAAPAKGVGASVSRRWPRPWSTSATSIAATAEVASPTERVTTA